MTWPRTGRNPVTGNNSSTSLPLSTLYPEQPGERDRWILARRTARHQLDAWKPYAFFRERECSENGEVVPVVTVFLTNRECPWRCLMCDLWKNTLMETVPLGAIPAQIEYALRGLAAADMKPRQSALNPKSEQTSTDITRARLDAATWQIKLYNAGSFFDPRAIPPEDHPAIAARIALFERVIVECHPALVGESAVRFRDRLAGAAAPHCQPAHGPSKLEVALGLETVHPEALSRLNKRMTLEQFARAASFLRRHHIALRVFVLVKPPLLDEAEALHWAQRSIDFAFDRGASATVLIPVRGGNGALEALAERGEFSPPKLATLEAALAYGIGLKRGRVFADTWDLAKFSACPACFASRAERLQAMNERQQLLPAIPCERCGNVGR